MIEDTEDGTEGHENGLEADRGFRGGDGADTDLRQRLRHADLCENNN